jgi:hypothetical protein
MQVQGPRPLFGFVERCFVPNAPDALNAVQNAYNTCIRSRHRASAAILFRVHAETVDRVVSSSRRVVLFWSYIGRCNLSMAWQQLNGNTLGREHDGCRDQTVGVFADALTSSRDHADRGASARSFASSHSPPTCNCFPLLSTSSALHLRFGPATSLRIARSSVNPNLPASSRLHLCPLYHYVRHRRPHQLD